MSIHLFQIYSVFKEQADNFVHEFYLFFFLIKNSLLKIFKSKNTLWEKCVWYDRLSYLNKHDNISCPCESGDEPIQEHGNFFLPDKKWMSRETSFDLDKM